MGELLEDNKKKDEKDTKEGLTLFLMQPANV